MKEQPMTEAEALKLADELVDSLPYNVPEGQPKIITQCGGRDLMRDRISAALLSATRPAPGYIRTHEGKDLRVLGTLPTTKDGCVVEGTSELYHPDMPNSSGALRADTVVGWSVEFDRTGAGDWQYRCPSECFSTRTAAEAAKREGENGE